MKICSAILCLLICYAASFAATQSALNQDKPARLYIKSYIGSGSENRTVDKTFYTFPQPPDPPDMLTDYYFDSYGYGETTTYQDRQVGGFSQTYNEFYNLSGDRHPTATSYTVGEQAGISWGSNNASGLYLDYVTIDELSPSPSTISYTNNFGTNNAPITQQQSSFKFSWNSDVYHAGYFNYTDVRIKDSGQVSQSTQVTMKLQTGGKANSKARNLFRLNGNGMQSHCIVSPNYSGLSISQYKGWTVTSNTVIQKKDISIGSYGNLNSDGVIYVTLADNDDVDVTPHVPNVDFFTFGLAQNKVRTKADWQQVVRDEIYSDTGGAADMNTYNAANGFMANRANLQAVYAFYQKLFAEDGQLYWAGLGKLAGAPVYAGLSDAQWAILAGVDLTTFQIQLVHMNTLILQDLAWQSEAYYKCGLNALETVNANEFNVIDIATWRSIDQGVQQNNANLVQDGNLLLARREQQIVLQPDYEILKTMTGTASLMSILASSPVPAGMSFSDVVPGGNLCVFANRWNWITNSAGGIWPSWVAASPTTRSGWVGIPLTTRAAAYSILPIQ